MFAAVACQLQLLSWQLLRNFSSSRSRVHNLVSRPSESPRDCFSEEHGRWDDLGFCIWTFAVCLESLKLVSQGLPSASSFSLLFSQDDFLPKKSQLVNHWGPFWPGS